MSELRPPVLRSKLRRPVSMFELVERTRLIDRLATSTTAICVVTAPPGYGKTTLVARAIDRFETPTAWLTIDVADDTPVRFWSHVAASLVDVGVDTDAALAPLLDGRTDLAIDQLIAAVEVHPESIVLVLDDVHELADERVLVGLERFLATPPAGLRSVLTTRHDIDLGLARLRLGGDVLDLGATDLAFTLNEGREALATELEVGLLDDASADRLVSELEGWPAGLRLAQLALRTAPAASERDVLDAVSGASPEVADYLAAEVIGSSDTELRDFLLDTSILLDLT
ncbi:MAG: AAA family ATPase, partial [Actinomycetota bacterium]